MNKNIYLIGFMGVGKSTVSRRLAEMTGWKEVDMDEEIVAREGMAIPQIFEQIGEDYFRKVEADLLRALADTPGQIISCGGGVILKEENRSVMRASGEVVLLSATPETIYERVKTGRNRPLLNDNMSVSYIAGLMEKRMPYYEMAKTQEICTDDRNSEEIAKEIYKIVSESYSGNFTLGKGFDI